MKKVVFALLFLLIGAGISWWLQQNTAEVDKPVTFLFSEDQQPESKGAVEDFSEQILKELAKASTVSSSSDIPSARQYYAFLIKNHQYQEAMEMYDELDGTENGETLKAFFRMDMLQRLNDWVRANQFDFVIDMSTAYLDSVYNDINVLSLLAFSYQSKGEYLKAIETYYTLSIHGFTDREIGGLQADIDYMLTKADGEMSLDYRWGELIGVYEQLSSLGLSNPNYLYRQAKLYELAGDNFSAIQILNGLTDDPLLGAEAQNYIDELESPEDDQSDAGSQGIKLVKRGEQYLVPATVNGTTNVNLMIDTGASVSVLNSFSYGMMLRDTKVQYISRTRINTAGGTVQANIYRADQITIADNVIPNFEFVVLDFTTSSKSDGLLGMNVLRKFKFELDQDNEMLYLQKR